MAFCLFVTNGTTPYIFILFFSTGGLAEFHTRFEDLCIKSKPTPTTPLYSPTTPTLVSSDIDNAVASEVLPFLYIGQNRANKPQTFEIQNILNNS